MLGQVTEAELVTHIRSLAAAGSPLTRVKVRGIAYEYAIANEIGGFSGKSTNKCAGYYWLEGFMKWNSELSVKKAEIFPSLEPCVETLGIKDMPSHLWNIDETGCQNIHKEVVGVMGEPTYNITALEKGETSTALVTINACGQPSPPMVIHRGEGGKIGQQWGHRWFALLRMSYKANQQDGNS